MKVSCLRIFKSALKSNLNIARTGPTKNNTKINPPNKETSGKLNINENGLEIQKTKDDTTNKTAPFDNLQAKSDAQNDPELMAQMEKRKDTFNTLDTPYIKEGHKQAPKPEDSSNKKE